VVRVGVLAIQGDFAAHAAAIARAGHDAVLVRRPSDFTDLDGVVLPGGESTAMLHGIARDGLDAPLRAFLASNRPVLATCAGAVLLARDVSNPSQQSYGALDMDVERNAYGAQIDSFEAIAETAGDSPFADLRCILIRAPRITRTGPGVTVHARVRGTPALVSSGPIWAATFHPELTEDLRVINAALSS
jgi:pyridoxal 5'-phosphate synthase pdxT subunit